MKQTKTELRFQQTRLQQFEKYLPTLQLKKAMLQFEVNLTQLEIQRLVKEQMLSRHVIDPFFSWVDTEVSLDMLALTEVLHVQKHYENIAGVEIPVFEKVAFAPLTYPLYSTPPWVESAIHLVREHVIVGEKLRVAEEKKKALEHELQEVSIRVNLFEKVLIPRAKSNVQKIRIFLGDQQLAAVAQAKVAKKKLQEKRRV